MSRKILIADDDNLIRRVINRSFKSFAWETLETENGYDAWETIKKEMPDLIILDLNMPVLNGREVLQKLKKDFRTMMIPVIILTGNDEIIEKINGLELGADDYMTKPFNINELLLKANNLIKRQIMALASNPLTGMPGAPVIEKIANQKISGNEPFAFMYVDIDNFKAYNDAYGYLKGDEAIKLLSGILKNIYDKFPEGYFSGHIGGDDFVAICDIEKSEKIADEIAFEFDRQLKTLYSETDFKNGFISGTDREGNSKNFPVMTLSISIVSNDKRNINHYAKMIDIAFEIKKYLKSFKDRKGSLFMKDRRTN